MSTPCYGKSALFDSTDIYDHQEAKELCATCPTLAACRIHLAEVLKTAASYGQPEGTWAGVLFNTRKVARRISREALQNHSLPVGNQANFSKSTPAARDRVGTTSPEIAIRPRLVNEGHLRGNGDGPLTTNRSISTRGA